MDAYELSSHIDAIALRLSQLDAPGWYLKTELKALFQDATIYENVVSSSPLTVAPIFSDLIWSNSPPSSLDFMSALPQVGEKELWACYGLVMAKDGEEEKKIYVGTGTDSTYGAAVRLRQYHPDSRTLPRFAKQAFANGYTIIAFGRLCWTDLPPPSLAPRLGARFKLL
jgi:hypothetical protein